MMTKARAKEEAFSGLRKLLTRTKIKRVREMRTGGDFQFTDLGLWETNTIKRIRAHQRPEKTLARSPGMIFSVGCIKARCKEVARNRSQASFSPREVVAVGSAWP
jgi:hypothetical protein